MLAVMVRLLTPFIALAALVLGAIALMPIALAVPAPYSEQDLLENRRSRRPHPRRRGHLHRGIQGRADRRDTARLQRRVSADRGQERHRRTRRHRRCALQGPADRHRRAVGGLLLSRRGGVDAISSATTAAAPTQRPGGTRAARRSTRPSSPTCRRRRARPCGSPDQPDLRPILSSCHGLTMACMPGPLHPASASA